MNIKRILLLGVAFASFTTAFIILSKEPEKKQVDALPQQPVIKTESVDILIATSELSAGDTLKSDKVAWQKYNLSSVPEGAFRKDMDPDAIDKLTKTIAKHLIFKGDPITQIKIITDGSSGFLSLTLPPGKQAYAIALSDISAGAGGFILPNSQVDILATPKRNEGGIESATRVILRDIKVLAVNQITSAPNDGSTIIGKSVTLELTPQQIRLLSSSQINDRISLALRSNADKGITNQKEEEIEAPKNKEKRVIEIINFGQISSH